MKKLLAFVRKELLERTLIVSWERLVELFDAAPVDRRSGRVGKCLAVSCAELYVVAAEQALEPAPMRGKSRRHLPHLVYAWRDTIIVVKSISRRWMTGLKTFFNFDHHSSRWQQDATVKFLHAAKLFQ